VDDTTQHPEEEFQDRFASRVVRSDYNGWTNWDTWNTALIINNEPGTYEESHRIVGEYEYDPERAAMELRDWAIEEIIGPYNARAIRDAQGWNEIPDEERIDYDFEDLQSRSPQAADLLENLGLGPDVSDVQPMLIDPELVNWNEIVEGIIEDLRYSRGEEVEYEDPDAPGDTSFPSSWISKSAANIQTGWSPLDYGSGPYSRLFIAGEPYESRHPYFKDGLQAFLDYYPHGDTIYIGFINVSPEFEGQGLARALLEDLYRRFPDKKIVWGRTMDDRIDHLKADFQRRFPERTSSTDWIDFNWGEAPQSSSEYYSQRQPWWANPETNEVFIGPKGTMHPMPVPQGFVLGEYWPNTGEIRATNWQGERAKRAEELVRQQLFPPMIEEESAIDRAMRKYRERNSAQKSGLTVTADADHWWEPAMTNVNTWVEIPGEAGMQSMEDTKLLPDQKRCIVCHSPIPVSQIICPYCGLEQRFGRWEGAPALYGDPDPSNNWLYLQGKVAFGDHYWSMAEKLAEELGLTPEQSRFISNQIARNHLVPNWDIAYGEIEHGKPRIWASTIDRNHVWDVVKEALDNEYAQSGI
jgi:ribosomal protein S18 acetylase RimI-like enzyme/RNA polymerase subunit RPABC4/transcription elongation factor Spt4